LDINGNTGSTLTWEYTQSTDAGVNWKSIATTTFVDYNQTRFCCPIIYASGDGKTQLALGYGNVRRSIDYGSNWIEHTANSNPDWLGHAKWFVGAALSYNGRYAYATYQYGTPLFYCDWSLEQPKWTVCQTNVSLNWFCFPSCNRSNDGQVDGKVVVVWDLTNKIWVSSDYGKTLNACNLGAPPVGTIIKSASISSDGSVIVVNCWRTGPIHSMYYSVNFGQSWLVIDQLSVYNDESTVPIDTISNSPGYNYIPNSAGATVTGGSNIIMPFLHKATNKLHMLKPKS
jgi:hypothetical protein